MSGLERFKIAQADPTNGFQVALSELREGRKKNHWIWFIFPQLRILGRSPTAQFYGFDGAADTNEFSRDEELSENLISSMEAVSEKLRDGVPMEELMGGYTDSKKLVSSCTLFKYAIGVEDSDHDRIRDRQIVSLAEQILELADAGGFAECSITREHLFQNGRNFPT